MSRVSLVQFGIEQGPRNFYNVHSAVGPGAPNRRDDVLLVQYFLRESFKTFSDPFPQGPLVVDGRAGPQTFAAIKHFQKVAKTKGYVIAQDGRVDPPVGEQAGGAISHTQYTILAMNAAFAHARRQDWPRVSMAADCPNEIRPSLREPRFVNEK